MTSASTSGREFSLGVNVADADIDAVGHANNLVYLRWFQDVAIAHSGAVGLDFEAYRARGAVFVVRRHEVDYLRSALRGDRVQVRTWIASASAATCERETEITREGGEILARGVTVWSYVELATGRPRRIPADIHELFGNPPRKVFRPRS